MRARCCVVPLLSVVGVEDMVSRDLTIKTDLPFEAEEEDRRLLPWCCGGTTRGKRASRQGSVSSCGIRNAKLSAVATSRVVSLSTLLALRVLSLVCLLMGGGWIGWSYHVRHRSQRSGEEPPPMLCLPDWSYAITALYFLVRASEPSSPFARPFPFGLQ